MEEVNLPVESAKEETVALEQTQVSTVSAVSQAPMPFGWNFTQSKSLDNIKQARALANMKHGMYSGVPIVCKGSKCPFKDTCWVPEPDREVGARCPIEVGVILERFEQYATQFQVSDDDTVDHGLIKDLVDIEIMMVRADNALAISGTFVEQIVAGIDNNGREIKRPELHKAFEAKKTLRAERIKILNQMNSTRKDKKFEGAGLTDPSSVASALMQKLKGLQAEGKIVDVTPTEATSDEVKEDA